MASKLDQSLDTIIQADKKPSRGGRGGSRGGRGGRQSGGFQRNGNQSNNGSAAAGPVRRMKRGGMRQATPYQRPAFQQQAAPAPAPQPQVVGGEKKITGDTIHISNLDKDVTADDVREIFNKVGSIKSAVVNYNQNGQSLGTAQVTFNRKQDAEKAVEEYDGAEVDGRAMYLKLVASIVTAPVVVKKVKPVQQLPQQPQQTFRQPRTVVSRGGQGGRGGRGGFATRGRGGNMGQQRGGNGNGNTSRPQSGRGRGGRGGARGGKFVKKEASADALDAELDNYHKKAEVSVDLAAAGQPAV